MDKRLYLVIEWDFYNLFIQGPSVPPLVAQVKNVTPLGGNGNLGVAKTLITYSCLSKASHVVACANKTKSAKVAQILPELRLGGLVSICATLQNEQKHPIVGRGCDATLCLPFAKLIQILSLQIEDLYDRSLFTHFLPLTPFLA